jgi:protein-disulfide isomerase
VSLNASSVCSPRLWYVVSVAVVFVAAACAPTSPAPTTPSGNTEIDLTEPRAARSSAWPPGLTPCAKDDPTGESCGVAHAASKDGGAPPAQMVANDKTVWAVPVGPDDPVRGPADALVTVVVFSDYECPFCKKENPLFEQLLKDFQGDVRLVWKDLPLPMHEHAEAAAELARAARAQKGDTGFWAAHDLLYEAQTTLGDPTYERICEKLGLPFAATSSAIHAARFGDVIERDVKQSDAVNVQATPTTYVNGRMIVGAQPYERLHAVVTEELAKAKDLVRSKNVPRNAVYTKIYESGVQVKATSDLGTSGPP